MSFVSVGLAVGVVLLGITLYYYQEMSSELHDWAVRAAEAVEENKEKFATMNKSAFVLGYTGEVGKVLVEELVKSKVFSQIILIGRREVKYEDEARQNLEQRVINFDEIDKHTNAFSGLQVGFCCLGTTRGKSGKDGFYKVDHDYVVNSAKIAKSEGCQHFHLVSSQGANKDSSFLYPKTKGEVEEDLRGIGFDRLSIYRPALLMCKREESRWGEAAARFLMKPVQAAFPTLLTVPTTTVAKAMVTAAVSPNNQSVEVFDNKAIHLLAGYTKSKKTK